MSINADNPLHNIVTTPESTTAEKRKQGAMVGAASMIVMPHRPLLGFFKKLSKGVGGKIAMGVLCAMIAGAIKDMPALYRGVRFVCSVIGGLGDAKATKAITTLINQGADAVKSPAEPGDGDPPKLTFKERVKKGADKVKEAAEETRQKVEDKTKPLADKADRAFDRIASGGLPPGTAPPQGINPPPGTAPAEIAPGDIPASGAIGYFQQPRPITPPGTMDRIKSGARGMGNGMRRMANDYVDSQAIAAEENRLYLEWWRQVCPFNGQCPRHHGMKVPANSRAKYHCYRCGPDAVYAAPYLRGLGFPPPPIQKPSEFFAWRAEHKKQEAEKAADRKDAP